MKLSVIASLIVLSALPVQAGNKATESPITMEQLMAQLRIQGGNFMFEFDTPVYARVTVLTTQYPEGTKEETVSFDTENPKTKIDLYFASYPVPLGERLNAMKMNEREMLIKLSECPKTEGTRIFYYFEKFSENKYRDESKQICMYKADVPSAPELDKDYILHWYFREGDPYQAKATIRFSATPFGN